MIGFAPSAEFSDAKLLNVVTRSWAQKRVLTPFPRMTPFPRNHFPGPIPGLNGLPGTMPGGGGMAGLPPRPPDLFVLSSRLKF